MNLPASIRVSTAVTNPDPTTEYFFYSYTVLAELEERGVGSILGYRPSFGKEFWLTPIHPPLVAFSGPSSTLMKTSSRRAKPPAICLWQDGVFSTT
jgi:hypothetical protein